LNIDVQSSNIIVLGKEVIGTADEEAQAQYDGRNQVAAMLIKLFDAACIGW
jgi:hypothetical protein